MTFQELPWWPPLEGETLEKASVSASGPALVGTILGVPGHSVEAPISNCHGGAFGGCSIISATRYAGIVSLWCPQEFKGETVAALELRELVCSVSVNKTISLLTDYGAQIS